MPLFFLIFYLLASKIEICLSYFLDKSSHCEIQRRSVNSWPNPVSVKHSLFSQWDYVAEFESSLIDILLTTRKFLGIYWQKLSGLQNNVRSRYQLKLLLRRAGQWPAAILIFLSQWDCRILTNWKTNLWPAFNFYFSHVIFFLRTLIRTAKQHQIHQ